MLLKQNVTIFPDFSVHILSLYHTHLPGEIILLDKELNTEPRKPFKHTCHNKLQLFTFSLLSKIYKTAACRWAKSLKSHIFPVKIPVFKYASYNIQFLKIFLEKLLSMSIIIHS